MCGNEATIEGTGRGQINKKTKCRIQANATITQTIVSKSTKELNNTTPLLYCLIKKSTLYGQSVLVLV